MTSPTHRVFDFREIAALDDTAVLLRNWVSKASSFFSEFWGVASGYGAQFSLGPISTETYASLLDSVPKDDFCCLSEFQGHASTMWFASSGDLRQIAAELLGLSDAQELGNGDLSPVELALAQLLINRLASSLTDGWMGEEEVVVTANGLEKDPRKTRIFRAKDLVTKTSIEIELKAGVVTLHWLMPKQKTCDLLETTIDRRRGGEPVRPSSEMVGTLPIEVVTVLGKTTIPMMELSKMTVGQLIMLDQRIDQPVTAYVNDSPFYGCWPGRIGKKQALEITSCLND